MKKTRLPSGGWLSRITGDWEPGHLEITASVLKDFGFSEPAMDISGDAAQDPDFYDWYTPIAHAQTDNDSEGKTSESMDKAIRNYLDWMKTLNQRLMASTQKDVRSGLFFLGYILHGIQDLATHQGITNAQHAYVSKLFGKKDDPDHQEENRIKAKNYSGRYIRFLKQKYTKTYKKLTGYQGLGGIWPWEKLMPPEKAKLLNKERWDLNPAAYIEYAALSKKYEKIKKDYPIETTLWNTNEVFEKLLIHLG
jgi:hypothetical protein